MRDNALYFPYISVPDNRWTIKILLYWDKLLSIVPMDYIEEPEQLDPFMRLLVQEQLVEQIFPANYLHMIKDFEKCFINLIRCRARYLKQPRYRMDPVQHEKFAPRYRIHTEKMGQIPEFLIEEGLAIRAEGSWYNVNEKVANIFMSYLASCLGALEEINAAPVTNQANCFRLFGNNQPFKKANSITHGEARDIIC